MKKNKLIFIPIFILIILILTIFLFFKKNKNRNKHLMLKNPNKIIKAVASLADIKINKFKLQQIFENNDDKWILKAQSGQIFRDKNMAKCKQSKVTFINKNKKIATLHAPETNFYLKENKIEMYGGIKSKITIPNNSK